MKFAKLTVIPVLLLILASPWIVRAVKASTTETKVFVHPDEMKVKVGDIFKVYVNASDVFGLQGFDFMLKYNTNVLDCSFGRGHLSFAFRRLLCC